MESSTHSPSVVASKKRPDGPTARSRMVLSKDHTSSNAATVSTEGPKGSAVEPMQLTSERIGKSKGIMALGLTFPDRFRVVPRLLLLFMRNEPSSAWDVALKSHRPAGSRPRASTCRATRPHRHRWEPS